ncbi:MAG: rhomboid family intramembrane serine protease [Lacinutrix sp.]|uniref:rhomboid family intramembrane serine protease n=1 Tax=Lacinutrix sp. TaxID=1937692 RepID=UPI0030962735
MIKLTETVKHIVLINVIFFIASITLADTTLFNKWMVMYYPLNTDFHLWQVVTHLFMHLDFMHLLSNMLLLVFIGTLLEKAIGKNKFLILYFSAGLGAVILSVLVDYIQIELALNTLSNSGFNKLDVMSTLTNGKYSPAWESVLTESSFKNLVSNFNKISLGASGAVMGVIVATAVLFPNVEFVLMFPPIPVKLKYLVMFYVGGDVMSVILTGTPLLASTNIGHMAHIGGAITGFIIMWYWKKRLI